MKKIKINQVSIKNSTPDSYAPAILMIDVLHSMWINLRPIMGIMSVQCSSASKSRFVTKKHMHEKIFVMDLLSCPFTEYNPFSMISLGQA